MNLNMIMMFLCFSLGCLVSLLIVLVCEICKKPLLGNENEVCLFKSPRLCPKQRWNVLRDFEGDDDYYLVISKDMDAQFALLKKGDKLYYDGQDLELRGNQYVNEFGIYKQFHETGTVSKYLIIDILTVIDDI